MRATSLEAYDSIQESAPNLRQRVLEVIQSAGESGLTIEEIVNATGIKLQTVCARRNELEKSGQVISSGTRRKTESGRTAIVWKAREK